MYITFLHVSANSHNVSNTSFQSFQALVVSRYNSVLYVHLTTTSYYWLVVTEGFLLGPQYNVYNLLMQYDLITWDDDRGFGDERPSTRLDAIYSDCFGGKVRLSLTCFGDVLASYLQVDDDYTRGICLADRRRVDHFWRSRGLPALLHMPARR